jgi:hypothetical protein
VWVDNVETSPNFGHAYVCWTTFKGGSEESLRPPPGPIGFARSIDGGSSWQLGPPLRGSLGGRHGCAIRTDSAGRVYVFWEEMRLTPAGAAWLAHPTFGVECSKLFRAAIMMAVSATGVTFSPARPIATVREPGFTDRVQKRCTIDGAAGARTNGFPAPDIANGAPGGSAPDTIAVAWSDGPNGAVLVRMRVGGTWRPAALASTQAPVADRGAFPAVALSPDGRVLYLVYTAFLQKWQPSAASPERWVQGVVRAARVKAVAAQGASAPWGEVRGVRGDARGSSAEGVSAEFLGDYDAVVATNDRAYAAWTDASATLVCDAVTTYREALVKQGKAAVKGLDDRCRETKTGPGVGKRFGNVTLCGVVVTASEAGSRRVRTTSDCKP